jgi:cytochrome P450
LPAFKFKYIKDLYPKFWDHTKNLIRAIDNKLAEPGFSGKSVVQVDAWLHRVSFDIIGDAGFGLRIDGVNHPESDTIRVLSKATEASKEAHQYRVLAFLLPRWLHWNLPITRRYQIDRTREVLAELSLPGITQRRALYSQKTLSISDEKEESMSAEKVPDTDVVTTLLRFPQPLSDSELLAQSASFLLAGQDTTSVAGTWALHLLSRNLSIQSKLREEVRAHLPSPAAAESTINAHVLESLPYLYAVCNEVLRLFTPVSQNRRSNAKAGTTIQGIPIPVGMTVICSPWLLHRSRQIWGNDALEFRPERFLKEDPSGDLKFDITGGQTGDAAVYASIPFGAGPRSCIGERFARAELASLVAGLVGRFEWTPEEGAPLDVEVDWGIVSKPMGGLRLQVKRVEGW